MYRITKTWTFEAMHFLTRVPEDHQCRRPHGHSYRVTLVLTAVSLDRRQMIVDYGELDVFGAWVKDLFDHQNLNDRCPVETTAENLARWIFEQCQQQWPAWAGYLDAVEVSETAKTTASFGR